VLIPFYKFYKIYGKRIKKKPDTIDSLFISISYDTDILAVENLFGVAKKWAEFVKNKDIKIELRTKSVNVDFEYQENLAFAFSLSPDIVIERYEKFTPNLDARIRAVKKIINKGYKPIIVFDPIIKVKDYKKVYEEFIKKVFSEINYKDIEAIVYGTFRMNSTQFKIIKKELLSDIFYYPYLVKNQVVEYEDKEEIIEFIETLLPSLKRFKT